MDIEVRYFDDCPSWQRVHELLETQVADLGLDARIGLRRVESHEDAVAIGFQGSPTVMVNGVDPFADPDAPVGLSCRVYRTEEGLTGSPTESQLRTALLERSE